MRGVEPAVKAPALPAQQGLSLTSMPALSLLFIVSYVVLTAWGMALAGPAGITGWYPAVGLALAAVTVGGRRWIPVTFLAALAASPLHTQFDAPLEALTIAVLMTAIYGTAGLVLHRNLDAVRPLARVNDAWWLIGVGVIAAPVISGVLNLTALSALGATLTGSQSDLIRSFVMGDSLGVVAVAPVLIVAIVRWHRFDARRLLPSCKTVGVDGLLALAALLALTPAVYLGAGTDLLALTALPLCWLALRFALHGAVLGAFAWSGSSALFLTVAGDAGRFEELQPFLLTGTMLSLIIGAVVSERERTQAELRHLAMFDQASGLPNEPHLLEMLGTALAEARGREVSLLVIRFTGLRQVGAALRSSETSQLVALLQQQVTAVIGPDAQLARPGFDRLAVVLSGSDGARRQQLAEQLEELLSGPLPIDSREVFVSPRIGITIAMPSESPAVVLAHADHAAEVVALAEDVRIGYYDASIERAQRERQELTEDLRLAVEKGEFLLAFQPIVTAKEGRVVGAEALLRWVDRKRGAVPPDEFIPIAEETGLILPIGRFVLNEACHRATQWPHVGGEAIGVSVNVSPIQMLDEGFVGDVAAALERSGLPAARLKVEITEGIELEDIDRTIQMIHQLRSIGVETMLDDFGTGHSSLAWVQRLPVTCIKIDRAFINGIAEDGIDRAIVHASLYLSRALGTDTVAEGVESEAQREQLIRMGCQKLQGFLFARPQPADVFPDWLARQRATEGGTGPRRLGLADAPGAAGCFAA